MIPGRTNEFRKLHVMGNLVDFGTAEARQKVSRGWKSHEFRDSKNWIENLRVWGKYAAGDNFPTFHWPHQFFGQRSAREN